MFIPESINYILLYKIDEKPFHPQLGTPFFKCWKFHVLLKQNYFQRYKVFTYGEVFLHNATPVNSHPVCSALSCCCTLRICSICISVLLVGCSSYATQKLCCIGTRVDLADLYLLSVAYFAFGGQCWVCKKSNLSLLSLSSH